MARQREAGRQTKNPQNINLETGGEKGAGSILVLTKVLRFGRAPSGGLDYGNELTLSKLILLDVSWDW